MESFRRKFGRATAGVSSIRPVQRPEGHQPENAMWQARLILDKF